MDLIRFPIDKLIERRADIHNRNSPFIDPIRELQQLSPIFMGYIEEFTGYIEELMGYIKELAPLITASSAVTFDPVEPLAYIEITSAGGVGNHSYKLDDGSVQTSNILEVTEAGTYTVTIYDQVGNFIEEEVIVTAPNIEATSSFELNVEQIGATITVNATGGVGTLTYKLDDGPVQYGNTFIVEAVDTYAITIIDQWGNSIEEEVIVTAPNIEATTSFEWNVEETEATITVNATGGVGTLSYKLDDGLVQIPNIFVVTEAGTYTVTIIDQWGSSIEEEVIVTAP